jgi:hypothetical protein
MYPPEQRVVWPGAVLGAITHAVFLCRCPDLSYEQSWDGGNYNVQDSAGSRGTIAFCQGKFVGAFFYESSNRNPFRCRMQPDASRFLRGMPEELKPLAYNETLQYLVQEFEESKVPIVTSAFWGMGKDGLLWLRSPGPVSLIMERFF